MIKKHYHATMAVEEDSYLRLKEISELLTSPKFKGISIKIEPDDLIPEYLQEETVFFIKNCLRLITKLRKIEVH